MSLPTPFCDSVAERLEAIVARTLSVADAAAVDEHLAACENCRVLVELAGAPVAAGPAGLDTGLSVAPPASDLTAGVLARTTGSSCARAHDLLCDLTDDRLAETDAGLLRLHLRTCDDCRTLSSAMLRLAVVLPRMAERRPDERFVEDVLARTLPRFARLRRRVARLSDRWSTLIQRPRFTWEAAYIGAIMLSLVFGAPASPLREVPKQALAMVQVNPFAGASDSLAGETFAGAGDFVWSWTGAPVLDALGRFTTEVGERYARTADERARFKVHAGELGEATLRMQGSTGLAALTGIGGDLKGMWNEMTTTTAEEFDDAQENEEKSDD